MTTKLFEPLTLRELEFRNRLWVPPMCQYSATHKDGIPNSWHTVHYTSMARGGAGAIIVEMTNVEAAGRISPHCLGLWNDEQQEAFTPIVEGIKAAGARAGIQIGHAGRKASTYPEWGTDGSGSLNNGDGGWDTVAPSAIAFPGLKEPRALSTDEIHQLVAAFGDSARRAVAAGFDFLEIHGAHGYLITEFLSPLSNERTDEFGGSLKNRARFLLLVADAMRAQMPEDMPLLARLSATEWVDGGITVEETVQVASWLKDHGVDLIDVSTGGNYPGKISVHAGYQTPAATQVKNEAQIPVSAVGMINEARLADFIVSTDQADVVMMGREILRDHAFPLHAAKELGAEIDYIPAQYQRAYRTRR
ncbi:MAG: NADH:flavin oxidoreductase/NADH oxidase [Rothia sp. (in: high G+C Gram-positive bacteria)]|nr:NADH:flavin oxidoreductase/NADH oxidase [Rothia sp. (in: high G+C Gram-positive bacteria)]